MSAPKPPKGPWRRVVGSADLGKIQLECGHAIYNSRAMFKARCWRCRRDVERGALASAEPCEDAPEDWSGLPTKASVKAQSRRAAQAQQAGAIAAYREAHPELNPQVTDQTVWALIFIEQVGKPSGASARGTRETSAGTDGGTTVSETRGREDQRHG